jgi:hypothetical protein
MSYVYACFISYKRPPKRVYPAGVTPPKQAKHVWLQLAEKVQELLDSYLTLRYPTFRDENLNPGTDYPQKISEYLCSSMFMVALIVPEYFESNWCQAEWEAMEALEKQRGVTDLIIPVICDGDPEELKAHIGNRNYVDLRSVAWLIRIFNYQTNKTKLYQIAQMISTKGKALPVPAFDCTKFNIAVGLELITPKIPEPSPFGH